MLRFAEEILLLLLDNEEGDFASSIAPSALDTIMAGAVLMDLALEDRIDTDAEKLMLTDATPVGDDLLDPVLADIAKEPGSRPVGHWLERTAGQAGEIRERALARLVGRGILKSDDRSLFFLSHRVLRSKRYPIVGGETVEEVDFRIMRLLFSDDIPNPRDVVIVSLAAAANVFARILSREELAEAQPRIDLIRKMDLIGRSVARAVAAQPAAPVRPAPPAEIPMAEGWPLVGSALALAGDLGAFLAGQYRTLGPVFQVRAFNRRFIVLAGPEANLFVHKRGRMFLRSHETWRGFFHAWGAKDGLIGMDGAAHVRMRRQHAAAFSKRLIENRIGQVVDITRGMIAEWPRNRPIIAHRAMQRLIAEQLGVLTTGVSSRDRVDDLLVGLRAMLQVHVRRQRSALFLRTPRTRRAIKGMKALRDVVLAHHAAEPGENRDLIDDLLELHRGDPQFFPETDLKMAVLGPYFAGIETAASTATFMLHALLARPELLERMTAEADAFLAEGALTPRRLRELDVTPRIVLETLRMYPVAPGLPRMVANSFEFGGYTVPAGAEVIVGNTVPHHLPEHFPEPGRFDIDRFTPERAEHKQAGVFAPFGLGTHRCLAAGLAENQIALTLLTILHHFELERSGPGHELKVRHSPTPHPAPSFKFRIARSRYRC